jgi:hypothetical protein
VRPWLWSSPSRAPSGRGGGGGSIRAGRAGRVERCCTRAGLADCWGPPPISRGSIFPPGFDFCCLPVVGARVCVGAVCVSGWWDRGRRAKDRLRRGLGSRVASLCQCWSRRVPCYGRRAVPEVAPGFAGFPRFGRVSRGPASTAHCPVPVSDPDALHKTAACPCALLWAGTLAGQNVRRIPVWSYPLRVPTCGHCALTDRPRLARGKRKSPRCCPRW